TARIVTFLRPFPKRKRTLFSTSRGPSRPWRKRPLSSSGFVRGEGHMARFDRRKFLKGSSVAAGGTLVSSVIESLISNVFAQAGVTNPKLIIYATGHGISNGNLNISKFSAFPEVLKPLQEFSSKVTVLRGLTNLQHGI